MADKQTPRQVRNPLTLIGIFAGLAEIAATAVLPALEGLVQKTFVWYVMIFPVLLVGAFFYILYRRPQVLYAPSDYREERYFVESLHGGVLAAAAQSLEMTIKDFDKTEPESLIREVEAQTDALRDLSKKENISLQGRSILWVDDRPQANRFERELFSRWGADITYIGSTSEAKARLKRRSFDLVISDIRRIENGSEKPEAGYELLEYIENQRINVPVVFYTSAGRTIDQERAKGARGVATRSIELTNYVLTAIG